MTGLLQVEELTVAFDGAELVTAASFEVGRGEAVGLVGESGSGKSLTALAVMGLLPDGMTVGGSVRLAGEELLGRSDAALSRVRGRRVSMVFQEPMTALNPVRTIGAQVAEGPRRHLDLSRRAARDRAAETLAQVGLPPDRFPLGLYPHQLSGGQRQRVVLAIALACEPDLLIADEPTTALDVTVQAQILELIAGTAEARGMGLLMISHDLGVIAETTRRMLVMYGGTLVEEGATETVFSEMAHPYTRALFGAMPARELMGARTLEPIPGQPPRPGEAGEGCRFAPRCPRVRPDCRAALPPLAPYGAAAGHRVRCLYPGPGDDG